MMTIKKSKVGGFRPGSGRPKGTGKYKEATHPIRVPSSLLPKVQNLLSFYLEELQFPEKGFPFRDKILRPSTEKSSQNYPLYGTRVAAGFPSPADDHIESVLDLNHHLVKHPAATFFVRVEGDSMLGAGIHPNDILVVDRSLVVKDGRIVIAVLNGELTVKRLRIEKEVTFLLPENNRFPAIRITEEMDFKVWGVVTSVIHNL